MLVVSHAQCSIVYRLLPFIPWSGEQSPRKAVGLVGPGPTGGPKVHSTDEAQGSAEETLAME